MNKGMEIAFFGSTLISSHGSGASAYYREIMRQSHRLGHRVTLYEPAPFEPPAALDRRTQPGREDSPWARVVAYSVANVEGVLSCLEAATRADLVIKVGGMGVFDRLLGDGVAGIRNERTMTAFWDADPSGTLDRLRGDSADPLLPLIPKFDLILTRGGGEPAASAYRNLGARVCMPIHNAFDPEAHHPVPPDRRFAGDAAYLGDRLADQEARMDEFYFKSAEQCRGTKFLLGGSGWESRLLPMNVRFLGNLDSRDRNALNSTPKAVIHVHRDPTALRDYSPPMRIFAAAGAGACILTDHRDGLGLFLEPAREILVARNGNEMAGLLKGLGRKRAADIGAAALRRVLAEHTYAHRARQLDTLLGIKSSMALVEAA
jgi:spore maturation protein CgeB